MIQFIPRGKKNFRTQETMFYAQMAPTIPMSIKEVIAQIERECTVAAPDVLAVVNALEHVVIQGLRNGHAIRLGELGSFRPTIMSAGSATEKEVTVNNIKRVRCRFTPSATINKQLALANIDFQMFKVPPKETQVPQGPDGL